ncbi:MAG: hypothetical protein JWM77_1372 [Rhodospirillales bacterium]|nr:hypothetical protein [Rhodospirillales bacterium]
MLPTNQSHPASSPVALPLNLAAHRPMDLADLKQHPMLDRVHENWLRGHRDGRPPARLDPLDVPAAILPYVMLLRLDDDRRLTVTLAGSFVCALHGGELRGASTEDFFAAQQAASVVEAARAAAATNQPSLAARRYVALSRRSWSYVRLLLPLAPDAEGRPRFYKALDPDSLAGM